MKNNFIELCDTEMRKRREGKGSLLRNLRFFELILRKGDSLRAAAWLDQSRPVSFSGVIPLFDRLVEAEQNAGRDCVFTRSLIRYAFNRPGQIRGGGGGHFPDPI